MLARFRQRLTYANVMSTVAVFIALGGSSYAALQIDSADIANNSVRGVDVRNRSLSERDVKRNALGGRSIRESRLGRVPRARDADLLTGMSAADLLLKCPTGTFPIADVCVETTRAAAASYGTAVVECANTGRAGRTRTRLPTHGELRSALSAVQLAPGGELTSRSTRRARRREARRAVRHRPGRQRGDHAEHRRRRQGVPLCRRPEQLTCDPRPLQHGREEMSSLSAHLRQTEDHSRSAVSSRLSRLPPRSTRRIAAGGRTRLAASPGGASPLGFSRSRPVGRPIAVASEPDEVSDGTSEVVTRGDPSWSVDFEPGGEAEQLPERGSAARDGRGPGRRRGRPRRARAGAGERCRRAGRE